MQTPTRIYLRSAVSLVGPLAILLSLSVAQAQKIDLNTNSMSDVWEALFTVQSLDPNADSDSDGVANRLEAMAATDPLNSNSVPRLAFSNPLGTNLSLSLPSARGKRYEWQSITGFGNTNWVTESSLVVTSLAPVALSVPLNDTAKFFRLIISDVDTDGDGLNDWEEYQLGLDPTQSSSNGQLDNNGQPMSDYAYASSKLASQNVMSIVATDPTATQPDPGETPLNTGFLTVTRGGFALNSLSVNLALAAPGQGVAVPDVDFLSVPLSLSFPAGVSAQTITVTPLPNTNRVTSTVATFKLQSGANYGIGIASNAGVVINPSVGLNGKGLTGQYFTNANSTYSNAANFNAANLKFTRVDPNIYFLNGTNIFTNWGNSSQPITNNGYYCVRWTGQIMPQYSELYYFVANTDDGVKVWVNDKLVVDSWIAKSASDVTGTIALEAGVRYNVKIEYFQQTGTASAQFSWYSPSQAKQIIPMGRLFPSAAAPSAVTSPLTFVGFLGQPFSNNIAGANTPLRFSATPLPPGLSFNSTNGALTGVPSLAGEFQLTVTSSNAVGLGASVVNVRVIDTGSSVTREVWTGIAGVNVKDIPVETPASSTNFIGTLEGISNFGDDYGERIRGYFTAPVTGNYYFWLAASDSAELWISNDSEPVNKVRRAFVTPGGTASRQWNVQSKQKSGWLALEAGERYYLEVLHKAGVGTNDNWAVGYMLDPTGTNSIASGTGIVPGYLLGRHFPLPPSFVPGTLYSANMLAQGTAVSSAVGSGTLRLSADETKAVLSYHASGFVTPVTGRHIHSDPYLTKPSTIIFDIDTATPQADGSYVWDITPVGTLSAADIVEVIKEGKTYINIHTAQYPNGEIRGNFTLAVGSQSFTPPPAPPTWDDDHASTNAAVRFLTQATFGASPSDIAAVQSLGYQGWISNQFSLPISRHLPWILANRNPDPSNLYPGTFVFNNWWQNAISAPDQLRQRVAFALSEVMVVSESGVLADNGRALASFYDTLLTNAFGNVRELLEAVTLSPAMGLYLDMRANDKGDIITGRHANENYGREILQLFSAGLYRMWPDGSLVMNSLGELVPTYDQREIMGFSSVFTGWNYYQPNQGNGRLPTNFGPPSNYTNPMVLVPTHHELGTKRLLDNVVLPQAWGAEANSATTNYDLYGPRELELAHDSIFYNENVGPFICRQLIQRLVTSHPTPQYLYRVVQKFNDNGAGLRGDMQAVINAILLDYEARSTNSLANPTFGKQREPLMRVTAPARAFPPPAPLTATYDQAGDRTITVNVPVTHRLNNGDTINLDFTDTSGHTPPGTRAYGVQTVFLNRSNVFTVNDPAFASGTYALTTNNTITNMAAGGLVTSNIVMVNINGHGLTVGKSVYLSLAAAGTYTQTNTVANAISNMLTASMATNFIMINIAGHGLAIGDSANLHFTTGPTNAGPIGGPASNAVYQVIWTTNNSWFAVSSTDINRRAGNCYLTGGANDGLQQVIWSTNNNWFAVTHPLANARGNNNCLIYKITGGGYTQNGTTVNISTPYNHGLNPGEAVYIDYIPGYGTDGLYTINTVPDATHFTVTSPTSQNQTQNGHMIFPQLAPQFTRSGNVDISWNTYSVNYTDNGASSSLSQTPLHSPTVFNFFFPDFKFPGPLAAAGLTTPEFMLTSDTEVMIQMNFLYNGVMNNGNNTNGLSSFSSGDGDIVLDIGPWMGTNYTANVNIPTLVDTLSSRLLTGQLSSGARSYTISYITSNLPYTGSGTPAERRDRVRAALHLLLMTPEFTIQR